MDYDVAVIGCGVSGANIARRLSAYNKKTAILEKAADVSFGTSKANSGIVHGGFHHNKKYLKARLEIQGNLLFDQLRRELNFPFKRSGTTIMNSEGRISHRVGNSTFRSDGSSTIHSGNVDFHSNGCTSIRSGNLTFHSDGHVTMKSGKNIFEL